MCGGANVTLFSLLVDVILSVSLLTGSQTRPGTSAVRRDRSNQRHSEREEAAGLQGGDHRWRGRAHSHPGNVTGSCGYHGYDGSADTDCAGGQDLCE